MITLVLHLLRLLPFLLGGHRQLALENLVLRQQLTVYKRSAPLPKLRATDRLFWSGLARVWTGWRRALVIVSPETVVLRHNLIRIAQKDGIGQFVRRPKLRVWCRVDRQRLEHLFGTSAEFWFDLQSL